MRKRSLVVFVTGIAVGAGLTALAMGYSFWLSHIHPVVLTVLAPGLMFVHAIGVTQDAVRWVLFVVFQLLYYIAVTAILVRLWDGRRATAAKP